MTDAHEIARGLTSAQRRAVLAGGVTYGPGYWPLRHAMRMKMLIDELNYLTPLGVRVRAILEGQK